jgi:hypothetical protein
VKECASLRAAFPLFQRLVPLLAGTEEPGTAMRTRVRAALSAIHGALVRAQPDDEPEALRATAVEVARAVLGLPDRSGRAVRDGREPGQPVPPGPVGGSVPTTPWTSERSG